MADDFIALADLVTINDQNLADIEVTDLLDDAPFMKALAAETASNGTSHKYTKETGAPVVGFRAPNAGREYDSSDDTLVTIDLKILDASFQIDKALADAYTKGGPEALVAREARRALKAAFFGAEKQFINGTVGGAAAGFTGLADALAALANTKVVNAAGTTAATASSIWMVRTRGDGTALTAIMGQGGNITIDETTVIKAVDGTGKYYPAYFTPIEGWLGLQLGSVHDVVRIANLTEDSGKGATDALIYKGLELFPAARQPNLIVMNRRSLRQLQASRTATNATGAPAPRPTEVEGIPIVVTDAILSTETLLA